MRENIMFVFGLREGDEEGKRTRKTISFLHLVQSFIGKEIKTIMGPTLKNFPPLTGWKAQMS